MTYKNKVTLLLSAISFAFPCWSQEKFKILEATETYQKQFVRDFLAKGATAELEGYPTTASPDLDFITLSSEKDWVIPMAELQANQWLEDQKTNGDNLLRLVSALAYSGTIRGLEFTARITSRIDNIATKRYLMSLAINSHWNSASNPNGFAKWYFAIESREPWIRDMARESISDVLRLPLMEAHLNNWAEAIVDRYGKEPTSLELLKDPLIELARLSNQGNPEELRQTLSRLSKQVILRRKNEHPAAK